MITSTRLFNMNCQKLIPNMGVEYGRLRSSSPREFYKGGSTPAEILLNVIAVTILANPEIFDVAKEKTTFTHSEFILFTNYLYS